MTVSPTLQDKPAFLDRLSDSQSDMQENWQYLQIALNKDHQTTFGGIANATPGMGTLGEGRHRAVQFPDFADPQPIQTADSVDSLLFSQEEDIWFRNADTAALQWTNATKEFDPTIVKFATANGWTFLPGGLLLQWGLVTVASGDSSLLVTFPVPFNDKPFSVIATSSDATLSQTNVAATGQTKSSFTVYVSVSPLTVSWTAIGR